MTDYRFIQDDIVVGLFLYYFIGLVISRIGSFVVEPVLRAARIIKFVDYDKFLKASKEDPKIEVLSETSNMYRTLCALFLLLSIVILFDRFVHLLPCCVGGVPYVVGVVVVGIFLLAYRKQTSYINRRINKAISGEKGDSGKSHEN